MELPSQVPVMTLPSATLFPQALLPLYIFEPRYRRMLTDMLQSHRMFSVAMQKPGRVRETPCEVAGLGLIRVSVGHEDGTSHLILQGLTRVELHETVQTRPYRVHQVRPVRVPPANDVKVDALVRKVYELVEARIHLGPFPFPIPKPSATGKKKAKPGKSATSPKEVLEYLEQLSDPEKVADLVSCAMLPGATERQTILETAPLEERFKHLIHFLIAENKRLGGG